MKVSRETLHQLIANKLNAAGLTHNHADIIADVLVYADARGIHSAPIVIPPLALKKPVPAAAFCMPITPPARSPPKWAWNMPLRSPGKMA